MRALVLIPSLVVLAACGPGSHERDGSLADGGALDAEIEMDARPPPPDAPDPCTAPMTEGCACTTPGATTCIGGGMGIQCCGGEWRTFWDGPCYPPPDGGATDCALTPREPGCPCATEGETACRLTDYSVVCTDGTWRERVGHQCC